MGDFVRVARADEIPPGIYRASGRRFRCTAGTVKE